MSDATEVAGAAAETPATEIEAEAEAPRGDWLVMWVGGGLCAVLTLGALLWAADTYRDLGLYFMNEQFYAAMLAVGLAALYLVVPARRGAELRYLPRDLAVRPVRIGEILPADAGILVRDRYGRERPLRPQGFRHFR